MFSIAAIIMVTIERHLDGVISPICLKREILVAGALELLIAPSF
ncbi:hypothetical protein L485_09305 [Sphingobium baderi LL03]|uniref:Uncharacterized protein n=1 Tax=Sphingobium baderi LL03 TaxID=1114964 RepID=T0GEM4_9SPHN|nr:hypothetical protein L485_09305 [Sphingobium baderi LL03]